jgi:hypothetical protein
MRMLSSILLAVLGALVLYFSLLSARVAYVYQNETIAGVRLSESGLSSGAQKALLAQRGTAAAYAASFAVLFILVAVGPYRKGDVFSWWALLAGLLTLTLLTVPRLSLLGVGQGVRTAGYLLGAGVLFLLLDVRRLAGKS